MKKLIIQSLKFFGISGIGWLMDMSIFTILTAIFKLNPAITNVISSGVAVTFVYIFSTRKIFQNSSKKYSLKKKYCLYVIYQIVMIILFSYIIGYFSRILTTFDYQIIIKLSKVIAKVITTPFTMIMNFIFMKYLIEKI